MAARARRPLWQALLTCLFATSFLSAQGLVEPHSGALLLTQTDLAVRAGAVDLTVERLLQTTPREAGLLGTAWRLNWETTEGRLPERDHGNGNVVRPHYGADGKLVRVEGPKGAALSFVYGKDGRLASIETATGARVQYTFTQDNLTAVAVNGGPAARYEYNPEGRLLRLDGSRTGPVEFTYDAQGRVVSRRFADASQERYEYGENWFRRTNAAGGATTVQWSPDRHREEITDPLGNKTTIEYNAAGLPLVASGPTGVLARYTYDAAGRTLSEEGPGGEVTSFDYLGTTDRVKNITHPDGSQEVLDYDANQNLVAVRRGAETTAQLSYYPDGLLRSIQGAGRPQRTYTYHPDGRVASVSDGLGQATRFEYDRRGDLVKETNPAGGVTAYRYDAQDRLVSVTDPVGATTQLAYDAAGRLASEADATGATTRYEYDARGRLAAVVDPAGRATRYQYNQLGLPAAEAGPGGATQRFEYDAVGNLLREVDPRGGVTARTYDALGRQVSETEPGGGQWRFEYSPAGLVTRVLGLAGAVSYQYDAQGRRVAVTGASGAVTRYQRDGQGRVTGALFPDGTNRNYAYSPAGDLAAESDNRGLSNRYEYDRLDRLARERKTSGLELLYQYDVLGNLYRVQDNLGGSVTQQFDLAGRLVNRVGPTDAATRYRYDPAGRVVEVVDPLGQSQRTLYTPAGEVAQVIEPTGEATAYSYGPDGALSEIRHPGGGATRLAWDAMGSLTGTVNPLGAKTAASYDAAGRLVRATDAKGQVARFTYDAAGRLTEKRLADGKTVRYKYDASGNLLEADDGAFPVRCAYDEKGRLIRVEYPAIRRSLTYAYDQRGLLAQFTDSEGRTVQYLYDAAGRVRGLRLADGRTVQFTYDAGDRLTSVRYPNGVRGAWEYDGRGLVTSIAYTDSAGAALARWTYTYDAADNLIRAVDAQGRATGYRYDGAGRLVEEQEPAGVIRYAYLPGGNRGQLVTAGRTVPYQYELADRLTRAGEDTFLHDANGNLIERRGKQGITRYQYDGENRLVRVVKPDGAEVTFGYAPTGERVWRKDASGVTWFVTDGTNLLAELDAGLKPKATYLHGPDIDTPLIMLQEGQEYFYHAQALGSVAVLTDASGKPAANYEMDAFGNLRQPPALRNPLLFTAREWEPDLGLYYFRARYYDPALGRFLSEDPAWSPAAEPLDLNRYVYARNAPTRYTDPTGRQAHPPGYPVVEPRIVTRGGQDYYVFYRGHTLRGIQRVMSDVMRQTGGDRAANYQALMNRINTPNPATGTPMGRDWLIRAHRATAQDSPLVSVTPDPRVAKYWSGGRGGEVLEIHVPAREVGRRVIPTEMGGRREWLIEGEVPEYWVRGRSPGGAPPGGGAGGTPTGYTPLTGGKSSVASDAPSKLGKLLRGLGAALGVAATAYGNYQSGKASAQEVVDQAVREGRTPTTGEKLGTGAVTGLKAGFRTALAAKTFGISEGVIAWWTVGGEIGNQWHDRGDQAAAAEREKRAKEMAKARADALLGTVSRWLEEARGLKRDQDAAIQSARDWIKAAQDAVSELEKIPQSVPNTIELCRQCQARFFAVGSVTRRMYQHKATLAGYLTTARERSASACQQPAAGEARGFAAGAGDAARSASSLATQMAGMAREAHGLEAERKTCVAQLAGFSAAKGQLAEPNSLVAGARNAAAKAWEASVTARNLPRSCWSLRERASQIETLTAQGADPTPIFSRLMDIESVCKAVDADATAGEGHARLADAAVVRAEELLPRAQEALKAQPLCVVSSPAAGQLEALDGAAGQAGNDSGEASMHATAASRCVSEAAAAKAATGSTPGVVAASRSSQPEGGQWEVAGYACNTQTVVFKNVQYKKVTNVEQVSVILRRGAEKRIIGGYSATSWLLRLGYLRYVTGVGLVESSKYLQWGPGAGGGQQQAGGRTARGDTSAPAGGGSTTAGAKPPAAPGTAKPPATKAPTGTDLLGVEFKSEPVPPKQEKEP